MIRTISMSVFGLALIGLLASGCCCSGDCSEDECRSDVDCPDDGVFCNGAPRCDSTFFGGRRECVASLPPVCSFGLFCDEAARLCVSCTERPDHPDCFEPPDSGRPPPVCAPDVSRGVGVSPNPGSVKAGGYGIRCWIVGLAQHRNSGVALGSHHWPGNCAPGRGYESRVVPGIVATRFPGRWRVTFSP